MIDLVRRDAWGAAAPRGKPVAIAVPVRDLFLHHSAGQDGTADIVRGIQTFHQHTRRWADIAYTWLYSPRNRVWFEGRGPGIAGGHTRHHNKTSHAVCILGNYQTATLPGTAIEDLAEFAAWHSTAYGPGHYRPHADVSATACPGRNVLNVLDRINLYAEAPFVRQPDIPLPPTLRLGATGDDVRLVQAAVLAPAGIYGNTTVAAVRAYQAAHGLTVDGICGPQTWSTILER